MADEVTPDTDSNFTDVAMDLNDVKTLAEVPTNVLLDQTPTEAVMTELMARAMPPESRWAMYPENLAKLEAKRAETRKWLDDFAERIGYPGKGNTQEAPQESE